MVDFAFTAFASQLRVHRIHVSTSCSPHSRSHRMFVLFLNVEMGIDIDLKQPKVYWSIIIGIVSIIAVAVFGWLTWKYLIPKYKAWKNKKELSELSWTLETPTNGNNVWF